MPDAITVAVRSSSGRRKCPCRLGNGLGRGDQCEQDEAIHLALILGRNDQIRIEATVRIVGLCRHDSSDPRGQGSRPFGKSRQA